MMAYIEREQAKEQILSNARIIQKPHLLSTEDTLYILDCLPAADVVEVPKEGIGELSDGYHTFNELYHHRAILFSVICNLMPEKAWKSKLHDTGDMFDGMFIVGIETEQGQATYHYDIEPYWDMFRVKELEKAPKWDGHTPEEAIDRISTLKADVVEVKHGEWLNNHNGTYTCSACGGKAPKMAWCGHCGAKMTSKKE